MEKENKNKIIAKVGMEVEYNNKKYILKNEKVAHGCKGCALYRVVGCPDNITSLCRQGFILQG